MICLLKMEFYHFIKCKSLYVILLLIAAGCLFSTSTFQYEEEILDAGTDAGITFMDESNLVKSPQTADDLVIGLAVTAPADTKYITVADLFFAHAQGRFLALFLCIFTVIYTLTDFRCGYIKNIAGQARHRYSLYLSKAIVLFAFTVLAFIVLLLTQALAYRIFLKSVVWGIDSSFFRYFGIQLLLHFSLCLVVMTVASLTKSNVVGIIFGIFACMNVFIIVYGLLDKLAHKAGFDSFRTITHTLTGKISLLPMQPEPKEIISTVITGIVFAAAALGIGSIFFQKRDINV